jgi:multidrug resistance efflux pump
VQTSSIRSDHSGTINQVRTHVGHVVKQVNRLLYTMSKQDVIRDANQFIDKVPESMLQVSQ